MLGGANVGKNIKLLVITCILSTFLACGTANNSEAQEIP